MVPTPVMGVSSTFVMKVSIGGDSKGSVYGLSSVLTILFCSLPFKVLVTCFFFPIFKFPGNFCSWIIIRGLYNCFDKFPFQVVFQDFDSAMIIEFDVGVFGQSLEVCKEAIKAFVMSEFTEFLVCLCSSVCIGEGFEEGIHEIVPKGFINFECSTSNLVIKVIYLFFFPGVHLWSVHVEECCYNARVWLFHHVISFVNHSPKLEGH